MNRSRGKARVGAAFVVLSLATFGLSLRAEQPDFHCCRYQCIHKNQSGREFPLAFCHWSDECPQLVDTADIDCDLRATIDVDRCSECRVTADP